MSTVNRPKTRAGAEFFQQPTTAAHRQYEALRAYFVEGLAAAAVAEHFSYTTAAFYALCRDFRAQRLEFFRAPSKPGPKQAPKRAAARERVIQLRKQNYSAYDIQQRLRAEGLQLSVTVIDQLLREEGFAKLPRRCQSERALRVRPEPAEPTTIEAVDWNTWQSAETVAGGVFVFVPLLVAWGLEQWPQRAQLPGSAPIPALNMLLTLLALKLTGHERLSHVMDVCTDPGLSLFAALNTLPKTTALSTYSYRVTRPMTASLLQSYHQALRQAGLVQGDCFNLDFHAIPQRGAAAVLEKHYVSARSRRERAILVFLVQDSDALVLCYADATLQKREQAAAILQFVEFWRHQSGTCPALLIFDSQLTTYRTLAQLDDQGIYFITLRRRGKTLLQALTESPPSAWKRLRLSGVNRRYRQVRYQESSVTLRGLTRPFRQLAVAGLGHDEPTLFLTNDAQLKPLDLVERYAHRMLIENAIAENVDFFHLDALTSAIALQVDLDVMLTLIANALYRQLARQLKGFETAHPKQLFRRFLDTPARLTVTDQHVTVQLQRRAHHPILLASNLLNATPAVPWWQGRQLRLQIG